MKEDVAVQFWMGTFMNAWTAIKGIGRRFYIVEDGEDIVSLLHYPDGSWGISRNGETIGIWEAAEKETCFTAFLQFTRRGKILAGPDESDRRAGTIGQAFA